MIIGNARFHVALKKNYKDMKKISFLIGLMTFFTLWSQLCFAQVAEEAGKDKLQIVGIWRINLDDQKEKLETEFKNKLKGLDDKKQEEFWLSTESRVYVFNENGYFKNYWVDNGAYFEKFGKWVIDEESKILRLELEDEIWEYRLKFNGKGMTWDPISKKEEFIGVLYLISLSL